MLGGPSSQHETIELRGFLDDDRREKSDERRNGIDKDIPEQNGEVDSSGESTKNDNNCESPMDLSIEKILKMDHIPGILHVSFPMQQLYLSCNDSVFVVIMGANFVCFIE